MKKRKTLAVTTCVMIEFLAIATLLVRYVLSYQQNAGAFSALRVFKAAPGTSVFLLLWTVLTLLIGISTAIRKRVAEKMPLQSLHLVFCCSLALLITVLIICMLSAILVPASISVPAA